MTYEFLTPANIWRDFDPYSLPLETTEVRSYEENGALTSLYYFTALTTGDGKVRCFVKISRPSHGTRFPTVLVIDSATEPLAEAYLSLVKEGFAVAVFDYAGRVEGKTYFTLYPDSLSHANFATAGRALNVAEPSAKHTSWCVWTSVARRVVTFLYSLDYVDSSHLGVLGVREGANVAWQTVGTDDRLVALATLYGWDRESEVEDEDEAECWQAGVAPESYMPAVKVPVLVAGGSNDRATEFSRNGKLANLPKDVPLLHAVSEGLDRKMYYSDMNAMLAFFRSTLGGADMPVPPSAVVSKNDKGEWTVKVTVPGDAKAEVFYAVGENQKFLSFQKVKPKKSDDSHVAKLGALTGDTLFVLAKGDYGTFRLSATPISVELGNAKSAVRGNHVVYTSSMGTNTAVPMGSKPFFDDPLSVKTGTNGIMGITSDTGSLALWVADITPTNVSALSFDTSSQAERKMTVNLVFDENGETDVFSCEVTAVPGKLWQRHLIELRDFKNEAHASPKSFVGVKRVEFIFGSAIVINNVLWI